jgi:NTE family protein
MKALVCSGGSVKGSHSCGVIQYLLGDLQTKYEILAGCSVGAINCGFLSLFPEGQEKEAALNMKNWWLKLDNSKIMTRWKPFGRLHAPWRKSFYDSSPLQDLIRSNITIEKVRASGKKVVVGAVSLNSGKYTLFNQDDDDFIDAILASSAFPAILSPIKMRGQLWMDGGIKTLSPISAAIHMGATEIDVITTSPAVRVKKFIDDPSILDIFKRAFDLSTDKILSNDIDIAIMHNELAKTGISYKKIIKLRIFRPKQNLIEDTFDFDPKKIREMIELGYNDAKEQYNQQ